MKRTLAIVLAPFILAACGDAEPEPDLKPLDTRSVSLEFEGVVGDEPFDCESTYQLGTTGLVTQISEFKMFVSNVTLIDASGAEVAMELSDEGPWQEGTVALIDFEDATGACANGTPETNTSVTGTIPADFEPVGVNFEVGVPFESNHQNQATAPDPLSLAQMFWNWQGGYKFIRVDGVVGESAGFRVHLGSTGCMLVDGSTTEVESCMNSNRIVVVRDNVDIDTDVFTVDAAELIEDLDLTPDDDGNSINCQSMPSEGDCAAVFPKFGLSFMGGDAGAQTFIQVR